MFGSAPKIPAAASGSLKRAASKATHSTASCLPTGTATGGTGRLRAALLIGRPHRHGGCARCRRDARLTHPYPYANLRPYPNPGPHPSPNPSPHPSAPPSPHPNLNPNSSQAARSPSRRSRRPRRGCLRSSGSWPPPASRQRGSRWPRHERQLLPRGVRRRLRLLLRRRRRRRRRRWRLRMPHCSRRQRMHWRLRRQRPRSTRQRWRRRRLRRRRGPHLQQLKWPHHKRPLQLREMWRRRLRLRQRRHRRRRPRHPRTPHWSRRQRMHRRLRRGQTWSMRPPRMLLRFRRPRRRWRLLLRRRRRGPHRQQLR